jgi:hypothetical protein
MFTPGFVIFSILLFITTLYLVAGDWNHVQSDALNSVPRPSCPLATTFPPSHQSEHLLHSVREERLNVFNKIRPLFFVFCRPNPLLSTPSSLFFAKRGVGVQDDSKIPQQQQIRAIYNVLSKNTNSLHFFATSTLCFHPFMSSFAQKHPGWG